MPEKPQLVRGLGLMGASAVAVGTIIGSGVFLVASEMTRGMGTPAGVFFVWVFGGALSITGALAYAELATMMPDAGGEYVYLREAYGPLWGFLYGWMQFLIGKPGSLATLGAGFARYFAFFFPALPQKGVSFTIIALLAVVNYFGVKASGAVQTFFTFLKIALILGLVGGALLTGHGSWSNFSTSVPVTNTMAGFVAALVAALWAYDGWNNIAMVSGEVENPKRNLPLALIAGTVAVGALYILANVAYFYVLPADKVAGAERVAADVAAAFMGDKAGAFVAIAAMVSIFAALNGSILTGSRVPFAMAADGRFFPALATIHPKFRGPSNSVIFLCAVALGLSLTGTYEQLFNYVIFGSWIFYGITAAAVFALRVKRPNAPRTYRTWGYPALPAVFVLVAAALAVSILLEHPGRSFVGLAIIAAGIPAFYYFERKRGGPGDRGAPAAAIAATILVCLAVATPAQAESKVMVFALGDRAGVRSLTEHAVSMDVLSPQSFVAHSNGQLTGQIPPEIISGASHVRVPMMPAVVNKDFSADDASRLLRSKRARARLASALVDTARRLHLTGFVIDFEGLAKSDRGHYASFLSEASKQFHAAHQLLGVAIPPALGNSKDTFDFKAIGRLADTVIVMAYDQHSRRSTPGPIAGYDWVEHALTETLAYIPNEKLMLGIPFYHRKWTTTGQDPAVGAAHSATSGTHREAISLLDSAGAEMQWDVTARSPWFSISNQTVWLEDSRSLAEKVALAERFHLAGVAAWRLGQEDPEVWTVLEEYRNKR